MLHAPLVYIVVTEGKNRMEISGSLDLFKKFMNTVTDKTTDPAPVILPNPDNPLMSHAQPQNAV